MFRFSRLFAIFALSMAFCLVLTQNSNAQYQVYTWNNFDSGTYPENLKRADDATDMNVSVVDYSLSQQKADIT